MIESSMISLAANNDAELVSGTLSGDRDAFAKIITRYQSLICSLTYSATGNLGHSEDLAQETFIAAWKHLSHLRERDKLRSWLCGIARNRINNFLRREGREPIHKAAALEDAPESHSPEPLPVEYTISKEEETILWRSLERIPPTYREPLVLFYREHQSAEAVAEKLELTVDTVHQRLSRGRKMLQEQVLSFVEGALGRTNPGPVFTHSVMAALPVLTLSAKAATVATVAAKGATMKAAGVMGLSGAIASPLLTVFGFFSSYRMNMDEAQTEVERHHVKKVYRNCLQVTMVLTAILAVPLHWLCRNEAQWWVYWTLLASQAIVVYFLSLLAMVLINLGGRRRYLTQLLGEKYEGQFPPAAYEFRSRATLLGLPLLHIRLGDRFDVVRGPVKAWIAIGSSHAVGVIFASGGLAIAPISFGGIAIGLVSFGAIAMGIFPLGAISLGVWAYGGLALGWDIFCGSGMAWNAASGGIVAAHGFASGSIAIAPEANTSMAAELFRQNLFFRVSQVISNHGLLVTLLWVIPVTLQARVVGMARRRREQAAS